MCVVYLYAYVHIGACAHVYAYTCEGQRLTSGVFPYLSSSYHFPLSLMIRSLIESKAHWFARLLGQRTPGIHLSSPNPVPELQLYVIMPVFYVSSGDLN